MVKQRGAARAVSALRACAVGLLALLAPGLAAAQQVTVFELDDYLDPRLLGNEFRPDGKVARGYRFGVVELLTGVVSDFEYQGAYNSGPTEFLHGTARLYQGRDQWNLLATVFNPRNSPVFDRGSEEPRGSIPGGERARVIPEYQLRLQYGRYDVSNRTAEHSFVDRLLYTVGYARTRAGDSIYDLAVVLDLPLNLSSLSKSLDYDLLGSVGYDWRIVGGGFDQHRLLYFYRWPNEAKLGSVDLPVRFSFGGERSEKHWRLAPIRLEVGATVPIEWLRTTLHFTYAPSYRPASKSFEPRWNHEVGVFLDAVPLTKVFARTRP